jgi:hypothetical protein
MTATASSFRVEVHSGGQLLAAYPAPFEAAAGSLATEVVRRLAPLPTLRVVVHGPDRAIRLIRGTLEGWEDDDLTPPTPTRRRRRQG